MLGLAVVLVATIGMPAEDAGPSLDLHRAIRLALAHQPQIAAAEARTAAAEDARTARAAAFLPQVVVEASDLYTGTHDGRLDFVDNEGPRWITALVAGSQVLYDRTATAGVAAARADVLVARFRGLTTRLEVAEAVAAAYLELDGRRAAVGVWESARRLGLAMEEDTRRGLEAGTRSRLDLLRARRALEEARRGLAVARARERSTARLLALMTGLQPLPPLAPALPIAPRLEVPSLEELETVALAQQPRLGMLRSLEVRREAELAATRGRRLPVVDARAAVGWDTIELPWHVPLGWSAGLYLGFPVFEGGAIAAREAAARRELEAASSDYEQGRLDLEESLARAHGEAEEALAEFRAAAALVSSSEEIVRISHEGYRAGRLSSLDLALAQRDQTSSRLRRLEGAAHLRFALVRLQLLTGRLPSEGPS